jgi:glycerophosphoryl diester phosphodiesterase
MIDTVVMVLEIGKFAVRKPEKFSPPADFAKNRVKICRNARFKYIYNPTKQEQEKGYYPRLTIQQQCFESGDFFIKLKIEFSAPKLMFRNNFDELEDKDFNDVVDTLLRRLEEMGIETRRLYLLNAYIQKIDYSKNIILDDYITCSMIIGELSKLNLNKRLDLTKTDYRNEGQAIAYHSSQFEIKIYDKIKDLQQSKKYGEKRSLEKDNQYQPDLFKHKDYKAELQSKHLEVLRFEGRFNRRKLKSLFAKLNIKANLTFQDVFKQEISKAVLMHYLNQIIDELYIMQFDLNNIDNLIASIKSQNPKIKPIKILQLIGFIQTVQSLGNRGARVELELPNHQWYRLQKELKQIESNQKNYRFVAICDLESKINSFETVKLKNN